APGSRRAAAPSPSPEPAATLPGALPPAPRSHVVHPAAAPGARRAAVPTQV
ncbi:unnamed protein product, partial [Urochloa humidicola]